MSITENAYKTICCIRCGDEVGSGFLIAPDMVLTADHVILPFYESGESVKVTFENDATAIECSVMLPESGTARPIALLKLSRERDVSVDKISDEILKPDDTVSACGFFPSDTTRADSITLKCVRTYKIDENQNVSFKPMDERRDSFSGFSGAPIYMDGHIVGMLIEQSGTNRTAVRLYGIWGVEFRELIAQFGVKVEIYRKTANSHQLSDGAFVSVRAVENLYVSQIDMMLNDLFEPIRSDRENGEILKSQGDLRTFLGRLEDRNCTDIKKAEFFYIGAIWMLLDQEPQEAETYYQKAKQLDPKIDDSVYCSYILLGRGCIAEAKNCLKPIDSTLKLNAYLSCLLSEDEDLPKIQAVLDAINVSMDKQTYRLLAIAALYSDCFENGHHFVEQAHQGDTLDVELTIIEALLYYWEVMGDIYRDVDKRSFAFVPNFYFCPNNEQKTKLNAAYQSLESIYDIDVIKQDEKFRGKIAWALLVISKVLPGKDTLYWLEAFKKHCPYHPLSIIYCTSNKIAISEQESEEFLEMPIPEDGSYHAFAKLELLLVLKHYEEAREFFAEHKELIAACHSMSVDECELQLMIECEDYSNARKVLKKLHLPSVEKERYEIGIQSKEGTKVFKPLVKKAIALAQKTNKTIDFHNASVVCRKYKKWNEAIKNAKEWWRATGELVALEVWIEALYEKREYEKCIHLVGQAEAHGDCSSHIKEYKLNSLIALARFEEARVIANTFENAESNARLTVMRARTYISEGEPDKAIQVLRAYADRDLYDFEAYQLLVRMIQGDDPEKAFHYANLLYQHDPENEEIIRFAGWVALKTGHDKSALSSKFGSIMKKDAERGDAIRAVTLDEFQVIMQEQREYYEKQDKYYREVKCPIHLVANPNSNDLGGTLWSSFEGNGPCFGRFGISKDIRVDYDVPLLLDYTSCLILCKLNLLETVCSPFKTIWVGSHLFEIWLSDITNRKNVQIGVVQKDLRLSDILHELPFVDYVSDEIKTDYAPFAPTDYVVLRCAKNYDALIVDDRPSGRIIGKAVPDEWYERNIGPNDFYAALASLNLRHPDFDKSNVNPEAVARIKPHCSLVLDEQVMLELLETDSIRDVFALFDIVLPDEIVRHIHDNAESHRQRACAAKWLEDSYDLVSNLRSKGKVVLKAAKVGLKVEENPYVQLLFDEFQIASEKKTTFIVDDRFTSSYHRVGSGTRTSNVVTTYDLLSALYDDQVIDAATFFNTIDKMYSIGYSYFVPPAEYLFSRLSYAKINSEGILEEYDKLKNIRKSVAFAFSETKGLISNQVGTSNIPEFAGYFLELNRAFHECLNSIWKSDESPEWCKATSNWLMAFFGDYLSDTEKGKQDTETMLVLTQTTLLALALGLSDNQKRVEYRRWLEPYMLASWRSNPTLVPKVAKSTLDYVDAFDFEDEHLTVEMIGVAKMLIMRFVFELPYLLRHEMLKSPRLAQYRKYISCNDELRISQLPEFYDCVDTMPVLDKAAILSGNVEAMEAATLFVLADLRKNTDVFINEFPIDCVYGVEKSVNYLLARFFSELAWYFPPSKGKHLHKLKRMLSIIS